MKPFPAAFYDATQLRQFRVNTPVEAMSERRLLPSDFRVQWRILNVDHFSPLHLVFDLRFYQQQAVLQTLSELT